MMTIWESLKSCRKKSCWSSAGQRSNQSHWSQVVKRRKFKQISIFPFPSFPQGHWRLNFLSCSCLPGDKFRDMQDQLQLIDALSHFGVSFLVWEWKRRESNFFIYFFSYWTTYIAVCWLPYKRKKLKRRTSSFSNNSSTSADSHYSASKFRFF